MMRRFMVYGLSFIVILLSIYHIPYTINPVFAAESTPSAGIKAKLEELKREIASKAAKLKQEINKKLQNRAYVGKVKTKTDTSITLATPTGAKIITINQDTVFESKVKKTKYSRKTLSEEDFIVGLGDIDDNGVLTAKKIILLPAPNPQPKTHLWGQIVSLSDKLASLKNRENKNIPIIPFSSSSVKIGDFVIVTGVFGKNDVFEAQFVHIVSAKTASPSAKIKK